MSAVFPKLIYTHFIPFKEEARQRKFIMLCQPESLNNKMTLETK